MCGARSWPQDRADAGVHHDVRSSSPGRAMPCVGHRWVCKEPALGSVFSFQCLAHTNCPSTGLPGQDLRRGGSSRKSKGKCGPCGQQLPSQDTERTVCSLIPENPNGELLSAVYNEPYSPHGSQHHPAAPPAPLDLSNVSGLGRGGAAG